MNTELDALILKIRKLFLETAYTEDTIIGSIINTNIFFNELKLLLLENVIIKEKEIDLN
jgi:hypothetical protein